MHQNRREFKSWIPTPIPSKSQNPTPDPPYEIIEFPSQENYSNTMCTSIKTKSESNKFHDSKCDLCGSSSAKFYCNMCTQQTFCSSCDLMYHRHPKRQSHIRQRITTPVPNCETHPPLPPKGETNPAPIPPPRRNKRPSKPVATSFRPPHQHTTLKKDGSFMGSLKRLVGGIHSPSPSHADLKREPQPKKSYFRRPSDFEPQTSSRGSDYLDWDSESRHRSGSFTSAFHAPAFGPLIHQAQSLAQLNCPSCYNRNLSTTEWSRSQMNLNAFPPWPGRAYAANTGWNSFNTFQPRAKVPHNNQNRRGSLNQRYVGRGCRYSSDEEEISNDSVVHENRKSRGVSPISPRRNQLGTSSDTEEETVSRKSDRQFKKRTKIASMEPSPAFSRRNYLKRCDDDGDSLSMKSVGSRRSGRSSTSRSLFRRNTTPHLSDSDDELTSDRDNTPVKLENKPPVVRFPTKFPEKHCESRKSHEVVSASIKPHVAGDASTSMKGSNACTSVDKDNHESWECEYCTYRNAKSSRVCDMCCKSRSSVTPDERICDSVQDAALDESMANMNVSNAVDVKKDDNQDKNTHKKTVSTIMTSPPQTISTQTYEELTVGSLAEMDQLKSSKNYSDSYAKDDFNNRMSSPVDDKQFKSTAQDSLINDDYNTTNNIMFKSQMKHGLEIIKLLREAENYQFTVEDLTAALAQCGDANPIQWLLENWNKLIESVVTLSTNYGREQPENTIGTISSSEATAALRMHNGDLWAAATECIRQRQKKYALLMAKGNFSREDVVTVLTANHGDLETALTELNKSHLRPFLMKIWGPPQGLDNDSGDIELQHHGGDGIKIDNHIILQNLDDLPHSEIESSNKNQVKRWLNVNPPKRVRNILPNIITSESIGQKENGSRLTSYDNGYENLLRKHEDRSSYSDNILQRPDHNYYEVDINGDEESNINIYDFLIREYVKLNPGGKELTNLRSSDDTEDDSVSELPIDSNTSSEKDFRRLDDGKTDVPERHSTNDSGQYFIVMQTEVEKAKPDPEVIHQFKNRRHSKDSSTDASTASVRQSKFSGKNSRIIHELKNDEFPVHRLFTELNALYLLVKYNLDKYIIGTKGTVAEDTNIVKKWINFDSSLGTDAVHNDIDLSICIGDARSSTNTIPKFEGQKMKALELFIVEENRSYTNPKLEDSTSSQSDQTDKNVTKNLPDQISFEKYTSISKLNHSGDSILFERRDKDEADEKGAKVNLFPRKKNECRTEEIQQKETSEKKLTLSNKEEISSPYRGKSYENTQEDQEKKKRSIGISSEWRQKFDGSEVEKRLLMKKNREVRQVEPRTESEKEFITPRNFITDNRERNHVIQNLETNEIIENNCNESEAYIRSTQGNLLTVVSTAHLAQKSDGDSQEDGIAEEIDEKSKLNRPNYLNGSDESNHDKYKVPNRSHDKLEAKKSTINEPRQTSVVDERTSISISPSVRDNIQNQVLDENKSTTDRHYLRTGPPRDNLHENMKNYSEGGVIKQVEPNKLRSQCIFKSDIMLSESYGTFREKEDDANNLQSRAQACLSEGLVSTYDQARVAVQLMELKFDRSQSIDAATECSNIYAAITYLQQECQLCTEKFSMKQMVPSLECEHQCCRSCAEQYYTLQITENNIEDCVCPFCKKPELHDFNSDAIFNYFSNLDILLKSILKPGAHELFQRKLRDRTLMQDPNFKWCAKCSFGFITDPNEKRLSCPSCKTLICAKCGKSWSYEHAGKTCNEYKQWLETQNDLNYELSLYMDNNGVTCPKCDTKFILVRGGCMHLTCSQCKYEFCSDCQKPFTMGSHCRISDDCNKLGLHAHHPRNCLFYLRDKEPLELKQLLQANNIKLNLPVSNDQRCQIQLQKERETGFEDTQCGAQVEEAGLCKCHLRELLSRLVHQNNLETIDLLNVDDLETLIMREGVKRPPRGYNTPQDVYREALKQNKVDPIMIFDLAEILQEFRRRGKSLPVRPVNIFEHEYRSQCIQIVKKEFPLE